MIPKELKALIDEHCMGVKDEKKISSDKIDLIYDKVQETNADFDEVKKYMDEVIKGPTKAEREAAAKAEAERKAKAEAERAEKERLAAIERAKREKREAAERAERERLAAIERAEKEKKEAAERAEREKKEAIFKELQKKYPTAKLKMYNDALSEALKVPVPSQVFQKPIDKWEDEFKASAKRQTIIKIKNIAYWVVFSILLIFTSVWVYQFAESTWDKVLSTILILMGFGVNLFAARLEKGYRDSSIDFCTIVGAGLLWQHFFVEGFWMTLLCVAIVLIFAIIVVNVYDDAIHVGDIEKEYKNYKVRRTMTWIIVALLYLSLLAYPFLGL